MPRKTGTTFVPWSDCQRCTFWFPIGQLVVQKGLRVCTVRCFDNTDIEYRPFIIQAVLSDPGAEEKVPLTPQLYWAPEEILF